MTNKIIIKEKTIILTIGVTNCGKSYFCENYLLPFLKSHNVTTKYLSSDKIRRELLHDDNSHKHNSKMMAVSSQAFSILENQLDNFTTYPVNTDVVIVDAMNISKEGRQFITKIAAKNNYKVTVLLFDYKERNEYFKYAEEAQANNRVIADKIKYFKETTLGELKRADYDAIYNITSTDFSKYSFGFEQKGNERPDTNKFERYCVVGDIHGCLDELLEAVTDNKGLNYNKETGLLEITVQDSYHHHILVGDYIDKGIKIKETIKFLYDNRQFFWIVRGNHENFVYKFLKGELGEYEKNKHLIDKFFETIDLIKDDEEYKNMFFELFENSFDFIEGERFIVTHAPCSMKYLGKTDSKSIKNQRTCVYPKRSEFDTTEAYIEGKEKFFSFLLDEAQYGQPMHFFGHVMVKDSFRYKNKYNLDTGCVVGNKLTTASFSPSQKAPFLKSYKSKQAIGEELNLMFALKTKDITIESLDIDIVKRLKWAAENKLNFISGTMSPCEKDLDKNDIESLYKGLQYYIDKGVNKVILQKKYMGSRGNLFLHFEDVTKCKLFSRQGFEVNNNRLLNKAEGVLENLYKALQKKYSDLFIELKAEYILFDGEILPWQIMGKSLIDREFVLPAKAIDSEIALLKQNGFFTALETFKKKYEDVDKTQLKPHENTLLKNWNLFKKEFQDVNVMSADVESYKEQLGYFIAEGELEFKPFSILKVIKTDGSEENWISETKSNIEIYGKISEGEYCVIDFKNKEVTTNYSNFTQTIFRDTDFELGIEQYWNYVTQQNHMEGVVIKPDQVYIHNVAPYLKCRNKGYLQLVYGIDYNSLEHKKNNLLRTKSIKRKIETSIKEWVLGKKMLDIKRKDISIDNSAWVAVAVQLISEQESEKTLDPRL